jgi:hypothetical protein
VPKGAYDPERVQLCAQGMILEEHGYRCEEGVLYFAESKERVRVPFDAELRALTQNAVDGMRLTAVGGQIPPPLVDSPKCPRCSLVGICLPDEVNFFKRDETPPRPLAVQKDEALPVYVQAQRAKVAKSGETLEISIDDQKVQTARLVSQLVLWGNVYVTTPALHELMDRGIAVSWHSHGGWFRGHTVGTGHKNVEIRTAQYRTSFDGRAALSWRRSRTRARFCAATGRQEKRRSRCSMRSGRTSTSPGARGECPSFSAPRGTRRRATSASSGTCSRGPMARRSCPSTSASATAVRPPIR